MAKLLSDETGKYVYQVKAVYDNYGLARDALEHIRKELSQNNFTGKVWLSEVRKNKLGLFEQAYEEDYAIEVLDLEC